MAVTQVFGATGDRTDAGLLQWRARIQADTYAEAFESPLPEGVPYDIPEKSRRVTQRKGGGYYSDIVFEGIGSFGGAPGSPSGQMAPDIYRYQISFSREAIEKHPKIKEILSEWAGKVNDQTGRIEFEMILPNSAGATKPSGLGSGKSNSYKTGDKNPLYGLTDYPSWSIIFSVTRVVATLPTDLLERIGKIVKSLPMGLPTPDDRDWKILPSTADFRGDCWQWTESWMLSDKGGWPTALDDIFEM